MSRFILILFLGFVTVCAAQERKIRNSIGMELNLVLDGVFCNGVQ